MSQSNIGENPIIPISGGAAGATANAQSTNEATNASKPKAKRKATRDRSEVWDHFDKFEDEEGDKKAKCKYCGKEYYADTHINGTSSRKGHMNACNKHPHSVDTRQSLLNLQAGKGKEGEGSLTTWKFDEDAIRVALCRMIIIDELPFKFVENVGFKFFMAVACPRFRIPTRFTISRDIYQLYLNEKLKLKDFLMSSCQMVSLTTDTWTSIQKINYMCLTAHWIDNEWKLNKRIINFCPISSHRGQDLAWAVETCLLEWSLDKVFTITVDNASSNDVMITHLKRKLNTKGGSVLQGKFLHMRCIAHIVNLVVKDGLKEIDESVARVRHAVRFVRQSPSRLTKFKSCIEMEGIESKSGLCLDVATRWNSTFLMLEAAFKFKTAFDRFERVEPSYRMELELSEGKGVPSEEDWENVQSLSTFLGVFYNLTLRVSGSLYITSNSFIHELSEVAFTLNEYQKSDDFTLSSIAIKMREKYDKYWGNIDNMNMLIFVSGVFDPRFKMGFVKLCLTEMYDTNKGVVVAKKVDEALRELFEEYRRLYGKPRADTSESNPTPSMIENKKLEKGSVMRSRYKKLKALNKCEESKSELDKYLNEENEPDEEDFDILAYWKVNSARFPIIGKMVRDLLAVPISTVASESAFSSGGRVLDPFRSSLSPRMVQALLCSEDWFRATLQSPHISVEEDLADIEKLDKDLEALALEPTVTQL